MPHVNFLQHIESNHHQLYKTAEQIYLGSIIASYLESGMDIDAKVENGITILFGHTNNSRSTRFTA